MRDNDNEAPRIVLMINQIQNKTKGGNGAAGRCGTLRGAGVSSHRRRLAWIEWIDMD
jgi:hypothetical protein